ncbi:hypothetical protein OEZ86_003539 [Tetradesmus obliquus]|nr:hypothetical protein OEZ86_003539 [Tetradesmus obliquus]
MAECRTRQLSVHQGVPKMQRKLLAATAAALLLLQLAAVLPVQAGSMRSLKQWGYDPWAGSGWYGGGWSGGWSRPWDPVGSGCYHPETYTRYRSGQSAYCTSGARIYCDWGNWQGSCRGGWSNGNDGVWRR